MNIFDAEVGDRNGCGAPSDPESAESSDGHLATDRAARAVFPLSWVTLGIYVIVMFYRRLNRADLFRDRRMHYYNAVIEASKQYAEEHGRYGPSQDDLNDLQRFVNERFEDDHKPIRAGLSVFLSFLTLGIYGFVWDYQLHTDPEELHPEVHAAEDTVLNAVRNVGPNLPQ